MRDKPQEIIYERKYGVYTDAEGWDYFNTPAEAGRKVERVLEAGLPRYRTVSASIEDMPKR